MPKTPATPKPQNRDFIRVGRSRIQGKGVFAKRKIPRGTRIIEYLGRRVSKENLFVEISEGRATPVYMFGLSNSTIIDGAVDGNDARFINHSCEPNCEAYVFDERVYIYAKREIKRGEELTFDYQLTSTFGGSRKRLPADEYACRCGSPNCRGTMLAPTRRRTSKR